MFYHRDAVLDRAGNVVPNATVTVTAWNGGAAASLYADQAGVTALGSNVITVDSTTGEFAFYAAAGYYRLVVTGGAAQKTVALILGDGGSQLQLSNYAVLGTGNEAAKFQAAVDAAGANGAVIEVDGGNFSTTTGTSVDPGAKPITWNLRFPTATLPTGLPGLVKSSYRGATYIVDGESSRNGAVWDKRSITREVAAGEIDRIIHIDATLPDDPGVSTQRELHGLSIRMVTDHHEPNGGDIRPIKAIVIADGGQANLRTAHLIAEGSNGHTGDLTGILLDVFHWDSTDGAYAPVGKAAGVVSQLGAGMQSGYTLRSRIDSHFTLKQRPAYGYRVEDGDNAVLPQIACFFGHGGGVGDFLRMARSDTDSTVVSSVDNLGRALAQDYRSGHQSISDDAVHSFTPACTTGKLWVHIEGNSAHWIEVFFRTTVGSEVCTSIAEGASASCTTGVLAGTTGVDGELTVSVSAGVIYIENRSGATRVATWHITGRS